MRLSALLLLAMVGCTAAPPPAQEVRVAAASDLNFAMKEMVPEFERETGSKVLLSLGSSGNFYAQIVNGAPFDVFLSADANYPRRLEMAGSAAPGSTFIYGEGRIAVWAANQRGLDVGSLGFDALLDPSVKKVAIANPDHAPYGRAAVAAMQKAGVYDRVKSKLVLGENISQAAQFVESGAADVGIIALSIAMADGMRASGVYWTVPADMHSRLEQGAVLLKRAGPAGKAFHEWLRSAKAKEILARYGFVL